RQKKLLIGNNTIQVWDEKKLDFICIINKNPNEPEEPHEKFQVIKIRHGPNKFDIILKERNNDKDIRVKIEHEDDIINIVRNAIDALKYLDTQSKSVNLAVGGKRSTFNDIVGQTRNIVKRFITLYPNSWRLLDFRYNNKNSSDYDPEKCISQILNVITANNADESNMKTKLKSIISKHSSKIYENAEQNRPLHSWLVPLDSLIPDYQKNIKSKEEKKPTKEIHIDITMLTYFLEYYSNNAMDNIGWMRIVAEVIPVLYEMKYGDKNYGWYAQEFFYKTCFGAKSLDFSSLKFHEVKKSSKNSLKVFIPITQLVPHDTDLVLKNISDDEIPYIRMVPLVDFTTNKDNLPAPTQIKKYLIKLFLPGKYSSIKNEDYSYFIRLLKVIEEDDSFYDSPSMEAIMNWMWYSSKYHWHHTLHIYVVYLLSYSIISWAYVAHLEVFQFSFHGKQYALDLFNWMDNIAIFLPFILSNYFLMGFYSMENGFKNSTTTQVSVFLTFMSILFLWYELGHALFVLLGYPEYISLSQAPDTYDVVDPDLNSNESLYTMVGEVPDNPFSNLFSSIIAVYNWDSIPNAFSNAERDSRRGVLRLQKELIYDYACLEGSSLTSKTNNFDTLFKDKLNVRYICFLDEPDLTNTWNEKSIELGSRWLNTYSFSSVTEKSEPDLNIDEIDFIWTWKGKKGKK
ncbi:11358_t:CDS:2, partial [Scutellospora calospora]